MTTAPANDLLGSAMVDFAAGRRTDRHRAGPVAPGPGSRPVAGVGPWGRWLQASLPAVLDLAHPAGWHLHYAATAGADYRAALSLDDLW